MRHRKRELGRNGKRDQTQKAKRKQTSSAATGSDELAAVIVPVGVSDPVADRPSAGHDRRSICSLNSLRTSSSSSQWCASSLRIRSLIFAFSACRRRSSAYTAAAAEFPTRSTGPSPRWLSGGIAGRAYEYRSSRQVRLGDRSIVQSN